MHRRKQSFFACADISTKTQFMSEIILQTGRRKAAASSGKKTEAQKNRDACRRASRCDRDDPMALPS